MKKFYSIVLMATALLIGTNVKAATPVSSWDALKDALQAGDTAVLSGNINVVYDASTFKSIWIGAKDENGKASFTEAAPDAVLDLADGKTITITANSGVTINPFVLTKGSLKVIGTGSIKIEGPVAKGTNVFSVFGANEANKKDPRTDPFSLLEIGKNVEVTTTNGTVILVDQMTQKHASLKKTDIADKGLSTVNMAYGARVDVYGTLKSDGANSTKCYGIKVNGSIKKPASEDLYAYVPYVYVDGGAVITSDYDALTDGSTAIYSSGFGRWEIKGNCSGATGVYISSGIVEIKEDAVITSAATEYNEPSEGGHANGSGSAIVINSRDAYAGASTVSISGNVTVSSTNGYAIEETVNTKVNDQTGKQETKVEGISISGGTFTGGSAAGEDLPAIVISGTTAETEETEVVVYGGNIINGAEFGEEGDLSDMTPSTVHTTEVVIGGKTVTVVSEGDAPAEANSVIAAADGTSIKWNGTTPETLEKDLTLDELEINEATAQVLTIADGVTLNVGRVILGEKAQIIVNAGAKLIVNGEQGFVAPVASNIVLKNEEGKRSIFLFNPAVESNRHPNATFDILSYSWRESASNAQSEVFGIPSHNAIKSVECLDEGKYGYIQVYGSNGTWENIGFADNTPTTYAQLNKPFAAYALTAYRAQSADKLSFRFGGELVGNTDAALTANLKWSFFANSYTAEVDIEEFLNELSLDDFIYVSNVGGNGYWHWTPVDVESLGENSKPTKLQPMQGFLLNNRGSQVVSEAINYKDMVYDPAIEEIEEAKNGAPARRVAANNNTAKMYVVVTSEAGAYDDVLLRETENIKSAEKYMNPDVNIYATAEEKSAIVNAEDLDNTYVGFSTIKGGKFTISFANVEGREFTLVDHETGARVEIAEGNTYEFTADENTVNDYRFEIVGRANMPTAIENTEAVKSAKGVYTITGQYVGEMNVWNALPAGVYVVNGEKRVK